jgi:hypothetical protein
MNEQEQSQQEFLRSAKAALELTWDALAERAGIEPRALKNYRLPSGSNNHRNMPKLARRAVQQLLDTHAKKNRKKTLDMGAQ